MGWKKIKEKYGIEHIIQRRGDSFIIGSSFVSEILTIDIKTGEISNKTASFQGFGAKNYPLLMAASKEEILSDINEIDTFSENKKVFIVVHDEVLETLCEEFGYPNITHDGYLMYENTSFTSKNDALKYLLNSFKLDVKALKRVEDEAYEKFLEFKKEREDKMVLISKLEDELDYL